MSEEYVNYPSGQIQMGSGDLQDAISGDFTIENNAKNVHTLRRNAAGYVIGVVDASGNLSVVVSENGPEKEYVQMVNAGRPVAMRYKMPLISGNFTGVAKTAKVAFKVGEAIQLDFSVIGKITFT
jgi:hypothetical protein